MMTNEMRRCDKLYLAITMYNDAMEKYVDGMMTGKLGFAAFYLARSNTIEDVIKTLFGSSAYTFVNRRKPYSDGKRDFIYKMMVMKEE